MSANRIPEMRQRLSQTLSKRRDARTYATVFAVLAVAVVMGVAYALMSSVMAAKHQIRVLDCPVTHAVAHHHDDSCYDDNGKLVCTLPELDVHIHDESCYERQLTCGLEEGEGAHYHDESCYDAAGNLVCGQEEGHGHKHDDSCYSDVLVCDKPEVTEEHVHGDGCFRTIAANEDAPEYTHPALSLQHDVLDADKKTQLRVEVSAPAGALPDGATVSATLLDSEKVDAELLQKTLDEHAAATEGEDAGRALKWQAVRIAFQDKDGHEIEPEADVAVKVTSDFVKNPGGRAIVRMDNPEGEARVLKRGERKARKEGEPTEKVIDQLTDEQLEANKIKLAEDQVAFEANESNCYVLTIVSQRHEMVASDGSTVNINVTAPAEAGIPADAVLDVARVASDSSAYEEYVGRTVEAMGAEKENVGLAQFFDIHIKDGDGNEIQPAAPVDVKIELAEIPEAPNGFAAVHFKETGAEDKDDESKSETELEQLTCGGENGTVTFAAESFSVYGIVYTVDFAHEVAGELYTYSIKGGGSIGLRELVDTLHINEGGPKPYENADAFMAEVTNVDFTNPNYIWLQQVSGETTLQQIVDDYDLQIQYSADVTEEQKAEWAQASYTDDWVLVSLKPFTTTEMLTITMADGTERVIAISDAGEDVQPQDGAPVLRAGGSPSTVYTPADTKIDLFDYWLIDSYRQSDGSWADGRYMAGKNNNGNDEAWYAWIPQPNPQNTTHNHTDDATLADSPNIRGDGYKGYINNGHTFKFHPSMNNTVPDGSINAQGQWSGGNDYTRKGINSYTGGLDPLQGLVEKTLNANGYPKLVNNLSIGANGEDLDYLFDPNFAHAGKASYPNVNNLMYVDENTGNYIYDSAAYAATFVPNPNYDPTDPNAYSGDFQLTEFPDNIPDSQASRVGFWPFGDRVYWFGMHVNSKFAQPHDGKVLDAHGVPQNMRFTFTGDDDTWIYVDGVLVGDGGGVHGRTVIDIDFALGEVKVYGNDGNQYGSTQYLDDLFVAAGKYTRDWNHQLPTSADDPNYVGNYFNGHAFKPGSKHVFDMFYLERGGAYSNLKVDYNLISTADFEARKVWHGEQSSTPALQRDQFHFELIGLDGLYEYTTVNPNDPSDKDYFDITPVAAHATRASNTDAYAMAIMPENRTDSNVSPGNVANATVTHPIYNIQETVDIRNPQPSTAVAQVYGTGVMEDGNIVFGTADISYHGAEMAEHRMNNPAYRYIVREWVPDDALSVHGIRWADATDEQRKNDGPFLKDNTLYDGTVYYMVGSVRETYANSGSYVWDKHFYKDDSFTQRVSDEPGPYYDEHFAGMSEFQNSWVPNYIPLTLRVVKRDGENTNKKLTGADFELRQASEVSTKKWQAGNLVDNGTTANTTVGNGVVDLQFMEPGSYILEETKAPKGYEKPEKKWLIKVWRVDDFTNPARPTDHLEASVTELSLEGDELGEPKKMTAVDELVEGNEIRVVTQEVDDYPFRFNLEKRWEGVEADDSALNNSNIVVTLGRYTIEDVAGTIAIKKTGVPEGANVTITYTIQKLNDDGTTWDDVTEIVRDSDWDENGVDITAKPIALAPGHYRVTENVDEDDTRYDTDHHLKGDTVEVWEGDIDEGDAQLVEYEGKYTALLGKISISSTLDNQTDPPETIDTSGVTYTIYASSDTNYQTPLASCTFAELATPGSRKEFELLPGSYRMVETGWVDDHGRTYHTNFCMDENGDPATMGDLIFTIENGITKRYDYKTTYQSNHAVYVILYKYDYKSGSQTEFQVLYERNLDDGGTPITLDERPRRYGPVMIDASTTTLRLNFNVGTNNDYPSMRRVGTDFLDDSYENYITEVSSGDWRQGYQVDIPLDELGDDRTIYVGNRWGLTDQNGNDSVTGVTLRELNSQGNVTYTNVLSGTNYAHLNPEDVENRGNGTQSTNNNRAAQPNASRRLAAANDPASTDDTAQNGDDVTLESSGGSASADNAAQPSVKNNGGSDDASANAGTDGGAESVTPKKLAAAPKAGGANGGGMMLRSVQPGNYGPTNTIDYGVAPDAPQPSQGYVSKMKYVEDTTFTTENTITLTKADLQGDVWKEEVVGLPAVDMEGNRYYYFIKKVEETHMPKNTTCTVTLESGKQILSSRTDDSLTGATLSLTNDIGNPADVDVYKEDATTHAKLDGAVFRLLKKVTDPDSGDVSEVVLKSADDIEVVQKVGGAPVTVDPNTGDFTVPATGITIKNVDPGTYILREVAPPPGYIMSKTDYEFEVSWLGVVTGDEVTTTPPATQDDDPIYSITIPNPPGEELPMSGGPGTILSTVAGVALAAFGALTLLRNRRRARVEEQG